MHILPSPLPADPLPKSGPDLAPGSGAVATLGWEARAGDQARGAGGKSFFSCSPAAHPVRQLLSPPPSGSPASAPPPRHPRTGAWRDSGEDRRPPPIP
jgi:hypothetical protein